MTSVGIDVGQGKLFAAGIHREALVLCDSSSPSTVTDWVCTMSPSGVGIDAPAALNRGLRGDKRIAEWLLGIGGCYRTPSQHAELPGWMVTGIETHEELCRRLGSPLDLSGKAPVFEVHPTYGFKSLLGLDRSANRVVCDPDRILKPKNPKRSVGHRQRTAMVLALLDRLAIGVPKHALDVLESSIDFTDAALAALLDYLRSRGMTTGIGDEREGTIVLADPSQMMPDVLAAVRRVAENEVATAAMRPRASGKAPTTRTGAAARTCAEEADGLVLRLGARAFGRLTQSDTIAAILGQADVEGVVLLPVESRIADKWGLQAEERGLQLLLAHGRDLSVLLHVSRVVSDGGRPIPKSEVLGEAADPWPRIESARYWVEAHAAEAIARSAEEAIRTNQDNAWKPGLPPNQTALIRFRWKH